MKTSYKLTLAGMVVLGCTAWFFWNMRPIEGNTHEQVAQQQPSPAMSTMTEASTSTVQSPLDDQLAGPVEIPHQATDAAEPAPTAAQAVPENTDPGPGSPADNFFDPIYGVTGKIPAGWRMRQAARWGNQENTLFFMDPEHPNAIPNLYYRMFDEPMQLAGSEIETWLRHEADAKVQQRVRSGLTDYTNRDAVMRTINDRPALTWIAEYSRGNEAWSEYLTRIYTPNGTLLFFLHAPAAELPDIMPQFESMIQTTTLP